MTQIEQILSELDKVGNQGLLSVEMRERTGIQPPTMRTTLYNLRRKEWIRKAGGDKGTYRYAITQKGRAELYSRQPLLERHTFQPESPLKHHEEDYENVLKLLDRENEYRLLRQFVSSLYFESGLDFSGGQEITKKELDAEVWRFMGVDPHKVDPTLEKLDSLVSMVRGTM